MLNAERRRQILREMGYRPMRLRSRGPATSPATPAAPAPMADARQPAARAPASTTAPAPTDPLWRALLAAAGAAHLQPADLGWEERLSGAPFDFDGPTLRINPIALRQQPAAKRALWKTLRSLRRRHLQAP